MLSIPPTPAWLVIVGTVLAGVVAGKVLRAVLTLTVVVVLVTLLPMVEVSLLYDAFPI